jgi:hypothetical protein
MSDAQRHHLPKPTDPLPSLTAAEREQILRAARLVKAGRLTEARTKLHQKRQRLKLEWAEGGGGRLCK